MTRKPKQHYPVPQNEEEAFVLYGWDKRHEFNRNAKRLLGTLALGVATGAGVTGYIASHSENKIYAVAAIVEASTAVSVGRLTLLSRRDDNETIRRANKAITDYRTVLHNGLSEAARQGHVSRQVTDAIYADAYLHALGWAEEQNAAPLQQQPDDAQRQS